MATESDRPLARAESSLTSDGPAKPQDSPKLVEHFFRREYSRLVASLTRKFGVRYLGLAEDAVQSALERALKSWPNQGIPPNPAGWLHQVACHYALDVLRRDMRWNSLDANSAVSPSQSTPFPTPQTEEWK